MFTRRFAVFTLLSVFAVAQADSPRDNYEKGMAALKGSAVGRDTIQARDLFRRAADAGFAPAMTVTAYYEETSNPRRALEWYQKAAEKGDPLAQWVVGRLYWDGNAGNARDRLQAERWLTPAANRGNGYAQYVLAVVKDDFDYQSNPVWFKKAAEQGFTRAQLKLAEKLDKGYGSPINRAEAYYWYLVADYSGERLQPIESELGAKQVETIKNRAQRKREEFRSNPPLKGCSGWEGWDHEMPSTPPPEYQDTCRM